MTELVDRTKRIPTMVEREIIKSTVAVANKKEEELIVPPKDFYKNADADCEIVITGEAVDTRVKAASKQMILQAITVDPNIFQNPAKKKLLMSMMEDAGLRYEDIFGPADEAQQPQQVAGQVASRAGGGVGASMPQNMVPGQGTKQL